MSAEQPNTSADKAGEKPDRSPVEELLVRWADYWGRAAVDAWRTVFPPKEDYR